MAALDTNIVIRLIVGDDPKQARAAEKLVASEPCTVAPSVLMECEWVLRGSYRLDALSSNCVFCIERNYSRIDGGSDSRGHV